MNRIIINNKTDLADDVALRLVNKVIDGGKVSNEGTQYCYLSVFTINGLDKDSKIIQRTIHVVCDKTKHGFSFQVYDERKWKPVPWSKR